MIQIYGIKSKMLEEDKLDHVNFWKTRLNSVFLAKQGPQWRFLRNLDLFVQIRPIAQNCTQQW